MSVLLQVRKKSTALVVFDIISLYRRGNVELTTTSTSTLFTLVLFNNLYQLTNYCNEGKLEGLSPVVLPQANKKV